MCVLIGKYFNKIGWVIAKNRDRGYVPVVTFRHLTADQNDRLVLWDEETRYSEGVNQYEIGILSTALTVKDDEKEGKQHKKKKSTGSKDGPKIRKALDGKTLEECLELAIAAKINGHTAICNRERLILLESDMINGKYEYKYKEIPTNETIARTNHGVWITEAGYQRDPENIKHTLSRISSEARMLVAQYVVDHAETPEEMINGLIGRYNTKEPQLNPLRMDDTKGNMFTTGQLMIIPKRQTLYYRPIKSKLDIDFDKVNYPDCKTWLEILSPRPVWRVFKEKE